MLGSVSARMVSSYCMTPATGHANARNASVTTIKTTQFALIATATVAATIAPPAPAHAGGGFASPSGDIACDVFTRDDGANFATCDIRDHAYMAPPKPASCQLGGWGDRLNMVQRSAPGSVAMGTQRCARTAYAAVRSNALRRPNDL